MLQHRSSWRCSPSGHHWTLGTGNPSHQLGKTLDLPCCQWTPWWQEQKPSCHLQRFMAPSGTGFHVASSVLHPSHGVVVGVTVPPRQPPGQVPAVEDKGWTTSLGEAELGPLHHPRWQEPLSVTPRANVYCGCHYPRDIPCWRGQLLLLRATTQVVLTPQVSPGSWSRPPPIRMLRPCRIGPLAQRGQGVPK